MIATIAIELCTCGVLAMVTVVQYYLMNSRLSGFQIGIWNTSIATWRYQRLNLGPGIHMVPVNKTRSPALFHLQKSCNSEEQEICFSLKQVASLLMRLMSTVSQKEEVAVAHSKATPNVSRLPAICYWCKPQHVTSWLGWLWVQPVLTECSTYFLCTFQSWVRIWYTIVAAIVCFFKRYSGL